MDPDFSYRDHGSILILTPLSAEAIDWIDINVETETYWGNGIVVGPRYFEDLYNGIVQEGFTICEG